MQPCTRRPCRTIESLHLFRKTEAPDHFVTRRDADPGPLFDFYLLDALLRSKESHGLFKNRPTYGSFNVNQVEMPFMPLRSTLLPSHAANAMGTDIPALNCVSLASPVSSVRFTTTRQVGPE
jgi:hypothetical protein